MRDATVDSYAYTKIAKPIYSDIYLDASESKALSIFVFAFRMEQTWISMLVKIRVRIQIQIRLSVFVYLPSFWGYRMNHKYDLPQNFKMLLFIYLIFH